MSKTLEGMIGSASFAAARGAAAARWPAPFRADLAPLSELYAKHARAPYPRFFRAAWEQNLLPSAARLWLDAVGRETGGREVKRLSVKPEDVRIATSSLRVTTSLFNAGMLVVAGDLEVCGELEDDSVGRMLVVEGTLRCGLLRVSGGVVVGRDLRAEHLVYGESHEDGIIVGGTLESPVTVIEGNKRVEARRTRTLRIDTSLPFGAMRRIARRLDPSLLLDEAGLDDDGDDEEEVDVAEWIDLDALYRAARGRQPILRRAPTKRAKKVPRR